MAGGLIHIGVGLLSALIVHLRHFKWEYSYAIFIGNLLPDALKFGLTALKQGTMYLFDVDKGDGLYKTLSLITSDWTNWFSLGFFVFVLLLFLYHYHIVKKKTFEEYEELYVFLLVGILTHLVLDILVIEQGVWV